MSLDGADFHMAMGAATHGLPLANISIRRSEHDLGFEMTFSIGEVVFAVRFNGAKLASVANDKRGTIDVIDAPFRELRRILDEAEQLGRDKERAGILGKLEARTESLAWLQSVVSVWRRWRRMRRALRRRSPIGETVVLE